MTVLIVLMYLFLLLLTGFQLKKIDVQSISFLDGVLVGATFYICIPMLFILINGYVYAPGIYVEIYYPFDDILSTCNIFIGWGMILILCALSSRSVPQAQPKIALSYLKLMGGLYVLFSIYAFYATGMLRDESHWHKSVAEGFEGNTLLIIFKNFSSAYRTMIFGFILYVAQNNLFTKKRALVIALLVVVFDLIVTSNRITMVYFFFFAVLLYIQNWKLILSSTILLSPVVMVLSNFWAVYRAQRSGFSFESFSSAFHRTVDLFDSEGSFVVEMNGIFESGGIVVLSHIIKNIGDSIPIQWGSTFLIRPLTTFIPSSIWPDKPPVFGTVLGEHINNSSGGLALNSTLFGEAIGNFYFYWFLVLFPVLLFVNWFFTKLNRFIPAASFLSFFVGLALWRFDMSFVSTSLVSLCFLFLAYKFLARKIRFL